jgi:hypothetical protein
LCIWRDDRASADKSRAENPGGLNRLWLCFVKSNRID